MNRKIINGLILAFVLCGVLIASYFIGEGESTTELDVKGEDVVEETGSEITSQALSIHEITEPPKQVEVEGAVTEEPKVATQAPSVEPSKTKPPRSTRKPKKNKIKATRQPNTPVPSIQQLITLEPNEEEPVIQPTVTPGTSCTIRIECTEILENMDLLKKGKEELVPKDGILLETKSILIEEGDTVFDILYRITRQENLHLEYTLTPVYNSCYIEGIANIYEFDCGNTSGWMFYINGDRPQLGASQIDVKKDDQIEFRYSVKE